MFHTLIDCNVFQKIRRLTSYGEEIKLSRSIDVLSFMLEMARKKNKSNLELIIVLY